MDQISGTVVSFRELRALGYSEHQVRRELRIGALRRVGRGAYTSSPARSLSKSDLELERIYAAVSNLRGPYVAWGPTAARLWRGWIWNMDSDVHIARGNKTGMDAGSRIVQHRVHVGEDECGVVGGLICTTLERTVLDVMRHCAPATSLAFLDSAFRLGLDGETVAEKMSAMAGASGIAQARRVWVLADGRSESYGETLLRYFLGVARIEGFVPQLQVVTADGTKRLDLGHPELKVGLEFDGLGKYRGEFGIEPSAAVVAERARELALRESGWHIERFMAQDLVAPRASMNRVREAMQQQRRRV